MAAGDTASAVESASAVGRARRHHAHARPAISAPAGGRIEQMMVASRGIERGRAAARGGDREVDGIDGLDRSGRGRTDRGSRPAMACRSDRGAPATVSPSCTSTLANPAAAQQVGHAIGDVALGDPVQRHGHARAQEADPGPIHRDRPIIDQASRRLDPVDRRAGHIVRMRCEMRGVQLPERLHRDVESAATQLAEALRLGEQDAEVVGCGIEPAGPVERGDLGTRQMQAEDPLETRDLVEAAGDDATRRRFCLDGRAAAAPRRRARGRATRTPASAPPRRARPEAACRPRRRTR